MGDNTPILIFLIFFFCEIIDVLIIFMLQVRTMTYLNGSCVYEDPLGLSFSCSPHHTLNSPYIVAAKRDHSIILLQNSRKATQTKYSGGIMGYGKSMETISSTAYRFPTRKIDALCLVVSAMTSFSL